HWLCVAQCPLFSAGNTGQRPFETVVADRRRLVAVVLGIVEYQQAIALRTGRSGFLEAVVADTDVGHRGAGARTNGDANAIERIGAAVVGKRRVADVETIDYAASTSSLDPDATAKRGCVATVIADELAVGNRPVEN